MAIFKIGDKVVSDDGFTATVVGSTEFVSVVWHDYGVAGTWPANVFKPVGRPLKPGDFVRVKDRGLTGYVFEDDGSNMMPFAVALSDEDGTEEYFDVFELELWTPRVGDRVVDIEDDDGITGTVVQNFDGTTTATVQWDGFDRLQHWQYEDLEPSDYEENVPPEEPIAPGDTVEYTNPFFSGTQRGKVIAREGNVAYVDFENDFMTNGRYPVDSLTKKEA